MTEEIKALLKEYWDRGYKYIFQTCDDDIFILSFLLLILLLQSFYFLSIVKKLFIARLLLSENCLMKHLSEE